MRVKDITGLDTATKAHEIYPMVMFIHRLLQDRKYSEVDDILVSDQVEAFSNTAMVSLIRSTYSMKRHLNKWFDGRDRVAKELSARGEDTDKILRGLYADDVPDCAELNKLMGLEAP